MSENDDQKPNKMGRPVSINATRRVQVLFSQKLFDSLDNWCKMRGILLSEGVRRAVKELLNDEDTN